MTRDSGTSRHDERALKHFEKRLLEERKLALRELGVLSETLGATQEALDGDLSNYRFHMADQGTDTMEREKSFLFASQEGRRLWQTDEALRRLYRTPETFGTCAQCGQLVDFDRLDAIPHAALCIGCMRAAERQQASGRAGAAPAAAASDESAPE